MLLVIRDVCGMCRDLGECAGQDWCMTSNPDCIVQTVASDCLAVTKQKL